MHQGFSVPHNRKFFLVHFETLSSRYMNRDFGYTIFPKPSSLLVNPVFNKDSRFPDKSISWFQNKKKNVKLSHSLAKGKIFSLS